MATLMVVLSGGLAGGTERIGSVVAVKGATELTREGEGVARPIAAGAAVLRGDRIRTLADGRVQLVLHDDWVLKVGSNTMLTIDEQAPAPADRVSLAFGVLRVAVGERDHAADARFEVGTSNAIASVKAGSFIVGVAVGKDMTWVAGFAGTTRVRPQGIMGQGVALERRQYTEVAGGGKPRPPSLLEEGALQVLALATATAAGGPGAGDKSQSTPEPGTGGPTGPGPSAPR